MVSFPALVGYILGYKSGLNQESVWGLGLGFNLLFMNVVKITTPLVTTFTDEQFPEPLGHREV